MIDLPTEGNLYRVEVFSGDRFVRREEVSVPDVVE
jgi:hypothetical protein